MTNLQQIPEGEAFEMEESDSSLDSELERLGNESPITTAGLDSPTPRGIGKTAKKENEILKIIEEVKALGSNTIDLCHKGLMKIPKELLELSNLEHLYLEGNELTSLPDDFFDKLPNLSWLDIRRNYLVRLPSVYTGRHQNLRTLLVEGNNLRSLPLELGLIRSLNGLNINNNPLEFPPKDVIEKGSNEILKFLREMLKAKSAGKLLNGGDNGEESSSSSDDWQDDGDLREYARRNHLQMASLEDAKSTTTKSSDLVGPTNQPVELHRPVSYTKMKNDKAERVKKAGASGTLDSYNSLLRGRKGKSYSSLVQKLTKSIPSCTQCTVRNSASNSSSVMSWKVNPYPEPPPAEYVNFKMNEERKLAKIKDLKEKTDAILQRRRDQELLKEWRSETKALQQKKYFESLQKGTKDFVDPVRTAPFDIDEDHIKVPTNEERIKQDVLNAHEKLQKIQRSMSPTTRQRIEDEKAARIRELERRIKQHTSDMLNRRKQPKGTPQEEMAAAQRELDEVKMLQKDLLKRYQELKAWTSG